MANQNYEQLEAEINALSEAFNATTSNLTAEQQAIQNTIKAKKAELEAIKAAEQAHKNTVATLAKFGNSMTRFVQSTSTQEGAFKTMGDTTAMVVKGLGQLGGKIPIFGGLIEGLGEAAGEAIKAMTEATGKAFATFGKLSQSGIVQSFQDMRDASERTGLMYDELEGVLSSHAQSMAILNGTTTEGSKSFQKIIETNKGVAAQALKLGYSMSEFAENQASYIEMQTLSGFAKGKSDKEMAEGAAKYAYELDTLSKLTGKQRADVQKEMRGMYDNVRVLASMKELGPDVAENLKQLTAMMAPEMATGIQDLVANAGAPVSEAGRSLSIQFATAGVNINELSEKFKKGQITAAEFRSELIKGSKKVVDATSDQAKVLGPDSPITKNYAAIYKMSQENADVQQRINNINEQSANTIADTSDKTGEAMMTARELALKSQKMLTSASIIMAANEAVGKGMTVLADTIQSVIDRLGGSWVNKVARKGIDVTNNVVTRDSNFATPANNAAAAGVVTRGLSSPVPSPAFTPKQAPMASSGIPPQAQKLLNFIGNIEAPGGYSQIYSGAEKLLGRKNLEEMTVKEVMDLQDQMLIAQAGKKNVSSAVGRFQFVKKTLAGILPQSGVKLTDKFDKTTQDKLAMVLLKNRGYDKFAAGKMSMSDFSKNLSKEWASIPTESGKSYYEGSNGNKALTSVSALTNILQPDTALASAPTTPATSPPATSQSIMTDNIFNTMVALLSRLNDRTDSMVTALNNIQKTNVTIAANTH